MRTLATLGAALAATSLLTLATLQSAHAQAFADAKSSRAAYSGGSLAPKLACEALADLKLPEVVKLARERDRGPRCDARALPRERRHRPRGRVRGEPAGRLERPLLHDRQRRPRGRGARRSGSRGAARPSARARLRDGEHEHRSRRAQGAARHVRAQQPAEGDRLRVSRRARHRDDGEGDREPLLRQAGRRTRTGTRARTAAARGCSRRSAIPTDFDGIVANAPWVDQTGFTIGAIWNQRALTDAPSRRRRSRSSRST